MCKCGSGTYSVTVVPEPEFALKHILLVLMVVLAIVRLSVNKRTETEKKPELQKTSFAILMLNALLDVAMLLMSSLT